MKKNNILILFALLMIKQFGFSQNIRIMELPESKRVDVLIDNNLFTSLLYADSLKKHILYPINAKGNIEITRGYPIKPKPGDQVDHPHQIGLWFNYGDVNGADYWNNSTKIDTTKKAYGTIKLQKVKNIKSGKGQAELTVSATWFNPGGKAVLEETSRFIFRENNSIRSITRETTLKALTAVLLKDNKEGLFALRVSRQLENPSDKAVDVIASNGGKAKIVDKAITTGLYENSRGIKGEAVFGTRSEWLKLSGTVDGKPISLAILDHPSNVNYPGFWMARGYGLFAINPLGAEFYTNGKEKLNFNLRKGEELTFKHQLVIGDVLSESQIEEMFLSFK